MRIQAFLLLFLLPSVAQATIIADSAHPLIFQQSGYNISITANQSFDIITGDSSDVNFTINSSWAKFNSTANLNLSNITYFGDVWGFNGTATSGTMTVQAKVANVTNYKLNLDGVQNQVAGTNPNAVVTFSYSGWSSHFFQILQSSFGAPVLTMISPVAYSILSSGVVGIFISAADQAITNYYWTVDGDSVSGTGSYSASWAQGTHYIRMWGSNANGNSNILEWRVAVNRLMAVAPVPTINNSKFNDLKVDTRAFDFMSVMKDSITPYTEILGNLFWLFVWLMIFAAYWIRQRAIGFPTIMAAATGGIVIMMLPEQYQLYAKGMIILGAAAMIYILFTKRSD